MRNARGELAERGELFGLYQAILCGAQFVKRSGEVVGALTQLVEKAGVLDGDHCLGGELLQQCDLLLRKRPILLSEDHDVADHALVLEQRYGEQVTRAADIDQRTAAGVAAAIGLGVDQVRDFDMWLSLQQASRRSASAIMQRLLPPEFVVGRGEAVGGRSMEQHPVKGVEHTE